MPPISLILAVLVSNIPVLVAIAIFAAGTAAAISLSSLPAELAAIIRCANRTRKTGHFPDRDDEDAVIQRALAHAWDASASAFLRWM